MKKPYLHRFVIALLFLGLASKTVSLPAQQERRTDRRSRQESASTESAGEPTTPRMRELGDQLRQSMDSTQQRSRRTQDTSRIGYMTRNLTGMETFGDALGTGTVVTGQIASMETFTFNQSMFSGSMATNAGLFTTNLASLTLGPTFGLQEQTGGFVAGSNTVSFSGAPANLANNVSAYLAQVASGTARDLGGGVSYNDFLVSHAAQYGIDPSKLVLDTDNSAATFVFDPANPGFVTLSDARLVYGYAVQYKVPIQPSGGAVYGLGRQKITENMTPVPTDRFFFDYSYFHNVPLGYGKMGVNRFTPGFEKTFWNKNFSFEMRLPFATTVDNEVFTNNANETGVFRMGDMTMFLKYLLYRSERLYLTLGLGISAPLAQDTHLYDASTGREVIRWKNETCHLMPYIGALYLPSDRVFIQGYFQVDGTTYGDTTLVQDVTSISGRMLKAGKSHERTYAYTSLALGCWLKRAYNRNGGLKSGMNMVGELHWTQSLDRGKGVRQEQGDYVFDIGNVAGSYHVLNLTLGTHVLLNEKTNIGLGFATPLSNGHRKQFDGELRLTCNRYF